MQSFMKAAGACVLALSLAGVSSPAFAGGKHKHDQGHHYGHDKGSKAYDKYMKEAAKTRDRREREAHDIADARAYQAGFNAGLHYGDRVYRDYRVIEDYQAYNLAPPPAGQYYAQTDENIVLVLAATQLIQQFLAPSGQ